MDIITNPRNIVKNIDSLPYISLLIKEERIKLGLSQEELSQKIGLGLKTLRKIEQGDLNVNFKKLNYVLNFLGMSLRPSELVTSPKRKGGVLLSQDYILKLLKHLFSILKIKYGVKELSLFGSYAKERATSESDIDLLIDFNSDISLEIEGEIQLILENVFQGVKVDLTMKKNLHQAFRKEIEETKIDVT